MKKILILPVLLLLALFAWNCEKDDICDETTATTPRLVVHFFAVDNPSVPKNVTNLKIMGEGAADVLGVVNGDSKVLLPLKTTDDSTSYSFILNSTSTTLNNEDKIQFNYTRQDIFVSRACGYKTIFSLDSTTPYVHTDGAANDGLWMQNIIVEQPNIETENETHISIYF